MSEFLIQNCQLYRPFYPTNNKHFQVRVKDHKIVAVEESGYRTGKVKSFDAQNRTLVPSYKDSHIHLLRFSLMKRERDLRHVNTWKHLQEELCDDKEKSSLSHNGWIVGRGLTDDQFLDRQANLRASDLDSLPIDMPIFLLHQDGHECLLNSIAIKEVQKNKDLEKEHDAFIEKDEEGNWTGRFMDTAVHFIKMNFRNKTCADAKTALKDVFPYLAEYGITHVDSDDLNYVGSYDKVWQAYTELDQEVGLPFGAYLHHYVYWKKDMENFLKNNKHRTGQGEGNVRVGAFKIFVDGTYRLHTAALSLPYEDVGGCGNLIYDEKELTEMLKLAEENRMQVAMHCIGDRAVEAAAIAIINANGRQCNPMRHRIIHMQTTRTDLMKTLARYKIPVETQPGFLQDDWSSYSKWVGKEREPMVGVGQSLIDNEVVFTSSSDAPIGPLNPAEHIYSAVNRTDNNGQPAGGWQPREKMSVHHAFDSYCGTPTYLNHSDKYTGCLLPGYNADMMLLEKHPMEVDPMELNKIKVEALWYRGRQVFDRYGN
ncbi:amidohydrolase [Roseivirga sp. BDSF3-8]|uniref:amidohydrolase n=1 Tax=Roseivirga sp. BDSF3-8 TaxID=3241598 RepID=UPI00353251F8